MKYIHHHHRRRRHSQQHLPQQQLSHSSPSISSSISNRNRSKIHGLCNHRRCPNIKKLAKIGNYMNKNFNMQMYDKVLFQGKLLIMLNQYLINLLIKLMPGSSSKQSQQTVKKVSTSTTTSNSANTIRVDNIRNNSSNNKSNHKVMNDRRKKNKEKIIMTKVSIICSCLNMIYLRCSWGGLLKLFQEYKNDDNKSDNDNDFTNISLSSMSTANASMSNDDNDDEQFKEENEQQVSKEGRQRGKGKGGNCCSSLSRSHRRNTLLNSIMLVLDTILYTYDMSMSSSDRSSNSSSNININSSALSTGACKLSRSSRIALSKTLASLARLSSVTNLSSSPLSSPLSSSPLPSLSSSSSMINKNITARIAQYMIRVLEVVKQNQQQVPRFTIGYSHCHAVTIFANLVNFDLHLLLEQDSDSNSKSNIIDDMLDEVLSRLHANNSNASSGSSIDSSSKNDKNDNYDEPSCSKVFRQESWRMILHLATFDSTRQYIVQRKDIMDTIHTMMNGNDKDDDAVYDRIIGVAILKKLGLSSSSYECDHTVGVPTDTAVTPTDPTDIVNALESIKRNKFVLNVEEMNNTINDLCNRVWVDTDPRVIDASLLALCEILKHRPELSTHEETKQKFISFLSSILIQKKDLSSFCHVEVMKVYTLLSKQIDVTSEGCWSVIETLYILAHKNEGRARLQENYRSYCSNLAQSELILLSKRICKVQQSRLFANIALALERGTKQMKLLGSIVLNELVLNESEIARMVSKDERICIALVKLVILTSPAPTPTSVAPSPTSATPSPTSALLVPSIQPLPTHDNNDDGDGNDDQDNSKYLRIHLTSIKTIVSISSSTTDIDDLVKLRDVIPTLLKFVSHSCQDDAKFKTKVKASIIQLSEAIFLQPVSV